MSRSWICWLTVAVITLVSGCAPGTDTDRTEPVDQTATGAAASGTNLSPASVLIAHRVKDFDVWEEIFNGDVEARRQASCRGHYLKRGLDDPEVVYVYCQADDLQLLRAFLASAELTETMKNAGVVGDPEIYLMRPESRDLVAGEMLPGIILIHEVEDYEIWRRAYDEFDSFRRESGIVGHAVSRGIDNPNRLVVYHQAENEVALRAFVDSAELKETMQRAGVVGDVDIRFIRVAGFGAY